MPMHQVIPPPRSKFLSQSILLQRFVILELVSPFLLLEVWHPFVVLILQRGSTFRERVVQE